MNNKTYFKHEKNQIAVADPAVNKLFVLLQNDRLIPEDRAVLYRNSAGHDKNYGFKTSLWINLQDSQPSAPYFSDFKGLWLIEHHNHKVQLLGSQKHSTSKSIGGRVIHDMDILNINAPWIAVLAHHLAVTLEQKIKRTFMDYSKMISCQIPESMTFYQIEHDLLSTAIQSFLNELDEKTITILQKEGAGNNTIYNHYVSSNPVQKRNRIQAADSYPWFSSLLRTDYRLRHAVDSGSSLLTELITRYQVKPRTIKLFQKFIQPSFLPEPSYSNGSRVTLMKSTDRYTAEYFPKTNDDNAAFFSISETLLVLADMLQVEPIQLAKPFRNGWQAGIEQLEKQLDKPLDLESIFEMMQASFYYGVMPLLESTELKDMTHPSKSWYKKWFSTYGLKRLLELANQWEQLSGQFSLKRLGIENINQKEPVILKWPALLPSNYSHGPYRVVELTSQHDLETEGRKLEHCVASYGIKCLISGSYIYSMRDRSGNSLSTFEVRFNHDRAELLQHNGMEDDDPSDEQRVCAEHFIKHVLSSVSYEQITKVEEKRHRIWGQMKGNLSKPNSQEDPLTDKEKSELQKMVAFTHPSGIRKDNILKFFNEASSEVTQVSLF